MMLGMARDERCFIWPKYLLAAPRVRPRVPIRRSKLSLKRAFSKKKSPAALPAGASESGLLALSAFSRKRDFVPVCYGEN